MNIIRHHHVLGWKSLSSVAVYTFVVREIESQTKQLSFNHVISISVVVKSAYLQYIRAAKTMNRAQNYFLAYMTSFQLY